MSILQTNNMQGSLRGGAAAPRLDKRLRMVANLLRHNRKLIDVGTDHGYLPAFMVIMGYSPCAAATDINPGPLENARATIEKYGIADRVSLILSDGLDNVPPDGEEIVMAGMGGELMCEIIGRAPWLKDSGKALVLQPMTKAEELRKYLADNGFVIEKETAVRDGSHAYLALRAVYSGETKNVSKAYFYIGELLSGEISDDIIFYTEKLLSRIKHKADALNNTEDFKEEAKELYEIYDEISEKLQVSLRDCNK